MFVSCFDIQSLNKIKKLKFRYNKIPSALISNEHFLIEVAREKKHTFLSTGMSNQETMQIITDVKKVIERISEIISIER
jgi:N-acetylneuraminate synthase